MLWQSTWSVFPLKGEGPKNEALAHGTASCPAFGDIPLSKISSFDIERYKHSRQQEMSMRDGDRVSEKAKLARTIYNGKPVKSSLGSINRELAALSHLFKWQ
jgi:hypothetical protein